MGHSIRRLGTLMLVAAAGLLVGSRPATAFPEPESLTGIAIEYVVPKNPKHRPIYERLKQRRALEDYKEFMAPLKMDRRLLVKLQDCDALNAWYSPGDATIKLCYDLFAYFERIIAQYDVLPGFQREDAVMAGFVSVLLHETGHAIFHILKIPVFGREEDAADAIAAFVMLNLGKSATRRLLAGTAHVWRAWELDRRKRGPRPFEAYSDEHGTDAQRFYNTLCIAHGSDLAAGTKVFADLAQFLPQNPDGSGRRGRCQAEYLQVRDAFVRLVLPHINQPALAKVRAKEWIKTADGKDILPPRK